MQFLGFGTVFCKNTALSTVLPYTIIRFYFIVGFRSSGTGMQQRSLFFYTFLYNLIIGSIFYALFLIRIVRYEDENVLFLCAYITTTFQGFIIVATITVILCTAIYIRNATISQKFLMCRNEATIDRQKIVKIFIVQIVLYGIQGLMELLSYVAMLNDFQWLCHYKFFSVLVFFSDVIEQICVIIYALLIFFSMNSYKKVFYDIFCKRFIYKLNCIFRIDNAEQNKVVLM